MLFVSVSNPEQIEAASKLAEALELRLDLFPSIDLNLIQSILRTTPCPIMLTLRARSHGGYFEGSEAERESLIEQLLDLHPPFFDLEYDLPPEFLNRLFDKYPSTKFILSYHNFQKIPEDLEMIYCAMKQHKAFTYKLAVLTSNTTEALSMLLFAKTHPKASVICMGEHGKFARVLGPVFGNLIGYASIDQQQTAPGQLTLEELRTVYHYKRLNQETAIYGLIGDPVEHSIGHLHHNSTFRNKHLNAVYVKMRVQIDELEPFITLAKPLGIRGLSVTMPLKEKILPFLDTIIPSSSPIGAINTLLFDNGKIIGCNTDGLGALDAIEKHLFVRGKKIVLLGAGGAARAIAFEAVKRKADVLILNRTVPRAEALAKAAECKAGSLADLPTTYDILINCSQEPMPIDPESIQPNTIAMDISYHPRETAFLKAAAKKNCTLIYGEEMFFNQAIRQTDWWLKKEICVPGSKSYTNRALILAALTQGIVTLQNPLYSDDTWAMIRCLQELGIEIETKDSYLIVKNDILSIQDRPYTLFAQDSGTTARFLLPLLCIVPGRKTLQGSKQLQQRPMKDLIDALRNLGAQISYDEKDGSLPVTITSSSLSGSCVHLQGDLSSQFCSALLLIAPYLQQGLTIHLTTPLISKPYVEMTIDCLRDWGLKVERTDEGTYQIPGSQKSIQKHYTIEGDFSSGSYFFAIGALTQSHLTVSNLNPSSLQADRTFLSILEKMGNPITYGENCVSIHGKQITPLDINMEDCPDQVMTMAILAAFAKGVTKISGVRSLRLKETDRLLAIQNELAKMGIATETTHDTLTIYGGEPKSAEIDTYSDHRIAMAFAVAQQKLPELLIRNPEVVSKTFPNFWDILQDLK